MLCHCELLISIFIFKLIVCHGYEIMYTVLGRKLTLNELRRFDMLFERVMIFCVY